MQIKQITNSKIWDNFVMSEPFTLFVQSTTYGSFYESMGEKAWILGIYDNETLVGGSLIVSTHARRGNFLYLPYGPILPEKRSEEALEALTKYLKKFAKEQSMDFIRVSPFLDDTDTHRTLFKNCGFRNAPMHVLAENTWLLNVQKSDEQLLSGMGKNHRNLIRRCEKQGVTVTQKGAEGLEQLQTMLDTTAKRLNFHRFSRAYVKKEFDLFHSNNQALIFEARLPDGTVDASAIIMFFGTMAVYRHSASLHTDKKLPTSYLIQWEVIQEAKRRGIPWYNFWGVAPKGVEKHPFAGIGHFKRGFGGMQKDLIHCQDLPITPKYWLNWSIETIRRIRRGF